MDKKLRNAFAGCSTTNNYYWTKGDAIGAFDDVLRERGYMFDYRDTCNLYGDTGLVRADVVECIEGPGYDEPGETVGAAILTWYRMPSGRYEFIGYLV